MTLTQEGRALAAEVATLDPALGKRLSRWLNSIAALEEYADEQVAEAMADELARAEMPANVVVGNFRMAGGMR